MASESSQFLLENYFQPLFPFLAIPLSKGVFYIIVASLCFGSEMGKIGMWSGIGLLLSGSLHIALSFMPAPQAPTFKMETEFFENSLYEPPAISPSSNE